MNKQQLIDRVLIAREIGRYEDMLTLIKQTAMQYPDQLNRVERDLLYQAYKQKYETTQYALTSVLTYVTENSMDISQHELSLTAQYISSLKEEIDATCHDIINLLENHLLPNATDDEQRIFYLMMKGDYHRYLFYQIQDPLRRKALLGETQAAYERARWLSQIKLAPLNPVRLATILNYIGYLSDILLDRAWACSIGLQVLEDARIAIERGDEMDQDCMVYLDRIHDNVESWAHMIRVPHQHPAAGDYH